MTYLDEVYLKDKTVILRVDYNVPVINGRITDDYRMIKSLKTVNYLIDHDCKIILMSHFGKVKTKSDKSKNSLKKVYKRFKQMVNTKVYFCNELTGNKLENKIKKLKGGQILFLENTRFMDLDNKKESECDKVLANYWAKLADIFVMDAFGAAHRNHASTVGVSDFLPTCYGFLIKEELEKLDEALENINKALILGGAKIEDKLDLIDNLLKNSSKMFVGGKMCVTFLAAIGKKVDRSQVNLEVLDKIKDIYEYNKDKIFLPIDVVTNKRKIKTIDELNGENIADLGPKTIAYFKENITRDDYVVFNGSLGNTDIRKFTVGTKEILDYLDKENIKTIIAGGDTASIANKYKYNFYHISTGGGATLNYLEQKPLKALGGTYEKNNIQS